MRWKNRIEREAGVPTAVLVGHLVLLLLLFFVAVTLVRLEAEPVRTLRVRVDERGAVTLDGRSVLLDEVAGIIARRLGDEAALTVEVDLDPGISYKQMEDVLIRLRAAQAIDVSFTDRAGGQPLAGAGSAFPPETGRAASP